MNKVNQKGSSLLLVQFYTTVLLMVVVYAVSYLLSIRDVANNDVWRTKAYYAAEGGIYNACEQIGGNTATSIFMYQIDGSSVKVEVIGRIGDQVALKSSALLPPYYAAAFVINVNTKTGKITSWEDIK
ncbi:hypothetical protein PP175_18605 [Aneurinibacillus sp. Ricciae_BoGa-3]|uniref:hypothetical protein n=1 Tax=Aneurinibacillus sp. Ricciae_BoGa-3 TaxID=3022697 RepID=UPI0023418C37|nr:hypothetical protein [Aneurinibacillus sp. Ricciae_BoGa-3]WCK53348.1 hypothetical protein PP175_18605 [Aneurinibacillus sp. Ricciae_BoGa-3]